MSNPNVENLPVKIFPPPCGCVGRRGWREVSDGESRGSEERESPQSSHLELLLELTEKSQNRKKSGPEGGGNGL